MSEEFDLFGDPVPEGRGSRGRPPHVPTIENRRRVNMLMALGWGNERIAGALRITLPTLRRHYFSELKFREVARDRLDMRRAEILWKEVEAGNVGAMREFDRFLEKSDLMEFGQTRRPRTTPPAVPRLGKKEAALAAAQKPDSGSPLGQLMARRQRQVN
ncbi:hypothetical protein [Terrihabitans sp. B22-R8]|uniref:hypothetical protein n=1 Tax=Terrihabitans sp. B22-R8 TaxID=3425128 RepID=UPI00403C6AF2